MKIDIKELEKRSEYIKCNKHDTLPLLIWNYTHECQFAKAWDEYTSQTRGLITDLNGNIIARPFKKFFNLNETEETKIENLPNDKPKVSEKLDGSLGIQYYAGSKVCIATRGSFNSDQAIWATNWISNKYSREDFLEGYTYLYEIIYPANHIVVNYQDRAELVLIAVINTETGEEIDEQAEADRLQLSCAENIGGTVSQHLEKLDQLSVNEEGFVVKYSNGLRLKMKGAEYTRIHGVLFATSTKSIWESLRKNDSLEKMLYNIPDELYKWIEDKRNELIEQFRQIEAIS